MCCTAVKVTNSVTGRVPRASAAAPHHSAEIPQSPPSQETQFTEQQHESKYAKKDIICIKHRGRGN